MSATQPPACYSTSVKRTLTIAGLAATATLTISACAAATPDQLTPTSSTTTSSLPPQPTLIVGKYTDPQAMVAKIQAAGVPLVADKMTYMNPEHTDINGLGYAYGSVGTERVGLFTFDWSKNADQAEASDRGNGRQTYRGNGWYISTKTPALLNQLAEILNK